MQCPQCLIEQPDDITFCKNCGAHLMQNNAVPTFSYLPPGTPPWPTTVPKEHLQPVQSTQAGTSSAPVKAKKASIAVVHTPSRNIISIIAILILAPLIGIFSTLAFLHNTNRATGPAQQTAPGGSTPTTVPTPATGQRNFLPNPKDFKTTQDTTVNISLRYPSDWTVRSLLKSSDASAISLIKKQYSISFSVMHLSTTLSTNIPNADQLNQSNVQSLSQIQSVSNLKTATPDEQMPMIGGAKWNASAATFTEGSNNKINFTTISVHHGQSYYVIYYFIPDSIYQQAMEKYIKPMLHSVKFLS